MHPCALLIALSLLATACAPARPERTPPTAAEPASRGPVGAVKTEPAGRWDALRRRGVDFVATGTEPFWSLELTPGQMRFRTVAGADSLLLPLPAPSQAQDAPVLRYRAKTAAEELIITIAQRPCQNAMSGEMLPYTVTVQAQTAAQPTVRSFAGCGRYLGDYRLHDLWALESMDGQAVVAAQFGQKKPYLELNLTTEQVLGFSGCNGLGGSLTPERAGLRFGTLRGTMMACPALAFEQKFLKALSGQSFTHQIENRRLTLKNRTSTLVFRKFD
ncbi:META domain-containing protein [Hymenobacter psychrophilus]|uniref:Heat shock protein HslJ n=1 Tax=Hymenobacter psychrophilus TaxID=651662 RepID=A0A1H3L208_9BACT|nr:META domain-containing protein [Hymenobacter psychrophilus]SDY58462.1 Heat shock protein HslJ [Hymenobacter psychrophilus]